LLGHRGHGKRSGRALGANSGTDFGPRRRQDSAWVTEVGDSRCSPDVGRGLSTHSLPLKRGLIMGTGSTLEQALVSSVLQQLGFEPDTYGTIGGPQTLNVTSDTLKTIQGLKSVTVESDGSVTLETK